ncbi:hypothetical protein GGF39_002747 [Coemansia sp. RSA 1721]|nr:hypothetical protein GGF39_002747 [Coemansia sp. RSA 1721]
MSFSVTHEFLSSDSQSVQAWSTADPRAIMGASRVAANSQSVSANRFLHDSLKPKAVPTSVWWQNLVLAAGDQPVVTSPYMVRCLEDAVSVCAPTPLVHEKYVASVWHDDWKVHLADCQHQVVAYDPVSVTVVYFAGEQAAVTMPLVRGSAFTTAVFDLPRQLRLSTTHAILKADLSFGDGTAVVYLNNGSVWLICCENNACLQQSGVSELESCGNICGAVRLALVSSSCSPVDDEKAAVEALLIARDAVPVGGLVGIASCAENTALFTINWRVRGTGLPLMYALPHHQMCLQMSDPECFWADSVAAQWSSRGRMRAVAGLQWRWSEDMEPVGFAGPTPLSDEHKDNLRKLVAVDVQSLNDNAKNLPQDPYFFGKAVARAMRIALIADEVGDIQSRDRAIDHAVNWLEPWLNGTNTDYLVYDSEWSGVISNAGLLDPMADFGQGLYNDHHFHYGYFIYAAAALVKLRPGWVQQQQNKEAVDILVRDYFNLTPSVDTHFPFIRCFDFFDGHSYANGLFEFADSRNQESTSEAINSYYATYLYAIVTGRLDIALYARAILQLEARTSRVYWHLGDLTDSIYPEEYAQSKAIVGILWSSKADYATWFGDNPEFIYGIQFLPYTPAMALLLKRKWVADIWPRFLETVADNSQTESWREIIHLTYAVVDKTKTFELNSKITSHDDGNSASNSYYWIATAP